MTDFERLYSDYAPRVRRFVLYLSGNAAVADDVTAETFVRVWTARGRLRHDTVRAFLFAIARNLFLQMHRRTRRDEPLDPSAVDSTPGPDVTAGDRMALARVWAALDQLPDTDRAAILMRAQEDMSYAEIGQALGISVAAAKVRVHRARRRLATYLPSPTNPQEDPCA